MQLSTHIKIIRRDLRDALAGNKQDILSGLRDCTERAKDLLNTDQFDLWLQQIEITPHSETPTTRYGLEDCLSYFRRIKDGRRDTRDVLESEIEKACNGLLTYMRAGDSCPLQSDYHYFVDERTGFLVKESDLGHYVKIHKMCEPEDGGRFRIARISELEIGIDELVS